MKTTSFSSHPSHGVKQRLRDRFLADNDVDPAGGAAPVALPVSATDAQIAAIMEQPHRPWLFQGMRNAL